MYYKTRFTIEALDGFPSENETAVIGYTDGETQNGYELPYFEIGRISAYLNTVGIDHTINREDLVYDGNWRILARVIGIRFLSRDEWPGIDPEIGEEIKKPGGLQITEKYHPVMIETINGPVEVYPVGRGSWRWKESRIPFSFAPINAENIVFSMQFRNNPEALEISRNLREILEEAIENMFLAIRETTGEFPIMGSYDPKWKIPGPGDIKIKRGSDLMVDLLSDPVYIDLEDAISSENLAALALLEPVISEIRRSLLFWADPELKAKIAEVESIIFREAKK